MGPSTLLKSLITFATFIGLALTPNPAYAQHGGGGHGGGGGGGGFHGGGTGGFHGGGGFSRGGDGFGRGQELHGGRSGGGERSFGRGGYSRSGGPEAARNSGAPGNRSSNLPAAVNDGQWHSFGNGGSPTRSSTGSSPRFSEGRNSGVAANSSLSSRNAGISDGAWHSFGWTSTGPTRGTSGFTGGASRPVPSFGRIGNGWRGGWGRGYGWGSGWGWGGGWGFGWPYWGFGWGFGWDPWFYDPFWYVPSPAYYYYPDYGPDYDWSDNPPPYRPDSAHDPDSQGSYRSTPSSTYVSSGARS